MKIFPSVALAMIIKVAKIRYVEIFAMVAIYVAFSKKLAPNSCELFFVKPFLATT